MDLSPTLVVGALAVIVVTAYSRRLGVAAPLVLVLLGVGVSFLPFVSSIEIEPELILGGVLPPLLYSASVSMPTMDFRRDFKLIGFLSVVLVMVTSVAVGFLLSWLLDVGLATGIALAAVVSPTDAVATTIVRRLGVSPRIVTILEGESLLNDASALVVLRSAVAAMAATVSLGHVALDFVYAVVVAVGIGFAVGRLSLVLRARLSDNVLTTASSFVVPFVAYLPAEHLGASGLVAVVVAGLITGQGAPRYLRPEARRSEASNWRTVETLLEGGVFLVMGLELYGLVEEVRNEHGSLVTASWVALTALVAVVAIRALFLWPMLVGLRRDSEEMSGQRDRLARVQERLDAGAGGPADLWGGRGAGPGPSRGSPHGPPDGSAPPGPDAPLGAHTEASDEAVRVVRAAEIARGPRRGKTSRRSERRAERDAQRRRDRIEKYQALDPDQQAQRTTRVQSFVDKRLADIDYLSAEPMGWRQGSVLAWAGMRGVVTVAAAQTLPFDAPSEAVYDRPLLILVAFGVAAGSLLFQGGTLPLLVRRLQLASRDSGSTRAERQQLVADLAATAETELTRTDLARVDGTPYAPGVVDLVLQDASRSVDENGFDLVPGTESTRFDQYRELRLHVIRVQRDELLRVRDLGTFSSESLSETLEILDADEIGLELRGAGTVDEQD